MSDRELRPRRVLATAIVVCSLGALFGLVLVAATQEGRWWGIVIGSIAMAAYAAARLRFDNRQK